MKINFKLKWLFTGFLLILFSSISAQNKYPSQYLIEAEDFLETLEEADDNLVIIDIRRKEKYAEGHLEKALHVWRPDIKDATHEFAGMKAPLEKMEKLFQRLGVTQQSEVVIYDGKGEVDAIRFWWILQKYGHKNVKLLNGGITNWQQLNYPVTQEVFQPKPTNYKFKGNPNFNLEAQLSEVQAAISDPNTIILDTRSIAEYTGEIQKKPAGRAGRIPTSLNLDFAAACNWNGDRKFRTIAELKKMYADKGITKDKKIIAYCASGVRSAHTTFVLTELLGFKNVKNFDGSWIMWSNIETLPIETGIVTKPITDNNQTKTTNNKILNTKQQTTMEKYIGIASKAYTDFANYFWGQITLRDGGLYGNYFWGLIILSVIFFGLEQMKPWRENQPRFRKDFWMDFFYMFFNFFLFGLIIFNGLANVGVELFNDFLGLFGVENIVAIEKDSLPKWLQLVILFVLKDFIEWWVHRLLHYSNFLWQFHKVHHSVEEMGFAAHLRYHWAENLVYKSIEYIPLAMLGFELHEVFYVHIFAIAIGHWNHANWKVNIGVLGYVLNNPNMHMWHHAYDIPEDRKTGINFGITLSLWDYIFGTNYIPHSGRDIKLGFPGMEKFPDSFLGQSAYGVLGSDKEEDKVQ